MSSMQYTFLGRSGLVPWSPLGGRLLGGILRKAKKGRRIDVQQIERYRPQLESYEKLCDELGKNPADIALAWLLHQPVVTAPIIGPRVVEQVASSLRALEISLTGDILRRL